MDVNIKIHALEKLVDYVASGIGSTAGHLFAGRIARREVESRLIAAEGEVEAQRMLAEGRAKTTQMLAKAQADARSTLVSSADIVEGDLTIGDLISQRIKFQEEKRQANVESVVSQACLELGDKEVHEHDVDHDWTARFFNEVQDVSFEGLQSLWARVLAGEVERPGGTSIKTLDVLRNLDKVTADLFVKLCSVCVSIAVPENRFIDARAPYTSGYNEGNGLREFGLAYGELMTLEEHGLITSEFQSWHDYNHSILPCGTKEERRLFVFPFKFQGQCWVLSPTIARPDDQEFRLSGVALTRSGWELSRIVDLEAMENYTQALVAFLTSGISKGKESPDDQS